MMLNPRFGKNPLKNVDCEVRYLLGINRHHTSAVVQPIRDGILTWKGITSAMECADLDSLRAT